MRISNKIAAIAAGFAILATPIFVAEAKPKPTPKHKMHHRHFVKKPHLRGVRYSPDGDLIDRNGWRRRTGVWDNTCLNLDYLNSMYACSSSGRK